MRLTGGQNGHGVDLTMRLEKGALWIVQCRNWAGAVGEPVVGSILCELVWARQRRKPTIDVN